MPPTPPQPSKIAAALTTAETAVAEAQAARKRFARRHPSHRQEQLVGARERCAEAAKPLRSYIGMCAWGVIMFNDESAMKHQIARLRYERRQLDKMLR